MNNRKSIEIKDFLHVNKELMIIYHLSGAFICKDEEEFSKLISQEKKRIADRDYVLNRFEHWEVNDEKQIRSILVARSRNNEEKNLVLKYMEHLRSK